MEDRKRELAMGDGDGPLVITFAETGVHHASEPHSHARGQLIGCARGVLSVETELGAWVVPARHAVWLPPHHVHCGQSYGPAAGWSLYLANTACAELPTRPCTLAVTPLLWEGVMRSAAWDGRALDAAQARLAPVIADEIHGLEPQPLGLSFPTDARLQRIARALLEDPADRRGLEAWASWAGVTPRTLSRRFVAETSLTFTAWIQRARLIRGLEMLATGAAVTTVALDLGYSSVSAFIALFKREFGATPTVYMERFGPPRATTSGV